jgi:hypothetical protein
VWISNFGLNFYVTAIPNPTLHAIFVIFKACSGEGWIVQNSFAAVNVFNAI